MKGRKLKEGKKLALYNNGKRCIKPRSPQNVINQVQFPSARSRTSHTESPGNKQLNLTCSAARQDLDFSFKGASHVPHLSLKVNNEANSRGANTTRMFKVKYQDCFNQLEVLQNEYMRALGENEHWRTQNRTLQSGDADGDSMSIMPFGVVEDQELRQSLAQELEDIYELLSNAHVSMAILLNSCDSVAEVYKASKTELNTLKFQNQATPTSDGQIKEVRTKQLFEELTRVNEEMKVATKEKQRLEAKVEELMKKKAEYDIENKALKDKIRVLSRTPEEDVSPGISTRNSIWRGHSWPRAKKRRKSTKNISSGSR